MKATPNRKNPLQILIDQEARQRRDALRGAKYVIDRLSGDALQLFVSEITALLRSFEQRMDGDRQKFEESQS